MYLALLRHIRPTNRIDIFFYSYNQATYLGALPYLPVPDLHNATRVTYLGYSRSDNLLTYLLAYLDYLYFFPSLPSLRFVRRRSS